MTTDATMFAANIEAARAATGLTIHRLPGGVTTTFAIAPHLFEGSPGVEVEHVSDPAVIASAVDAIVAGQPYFWEWSLDARAALIFTDAADVRLLTVYLGSFDWSVEIAGIPCIFEEPVLANWLRARYEGLQTKQ